MKGRLELVTWSAPPNESNGWGALEWGYVILDEAADLIRSLK